MVAVSSFSSTIGRVSSLVELNIGVVEQHAVVREALSRMVASVPDMAVSTAVAKVVDIDFSAVNAPRVILVGAPNTPDECRSTLGHIASQSPGVYAVVILGSHDSRIVAAAVEAGARGLLCADTPPDAFVHALRAAATGAAVLDANLLAALSPASKLTQAPLLSAREMEVLSMVASGSSNAEIADKLYISVETVKSHVAHLLRKLEVSNRREASREARRLGLVAEQGANRPARQRLVR